MVPMARDLVLGEDVVPAVAARRALYTLVPMSLIKRYVTENDLRREAVGLAKAGRMVNPLAADVETDRKRKMVALLQRYNYFRKFKQHYRLDQ